MKKGFFIIPLILLVLLLAACVGEETAEQPEKVIVVNDRTGETHEATQKVVYMVDGDGNVDENPTIVYLNNDPSPDAINVILVPLDGMAPATRCTIETVESVQMQLCPQEVVLDGGVKKQVFHQSRYLPGQNPVPPSGGDNTCCVTCCCNNCDSSGGGQGAEPAPPAQSEKITAAKTCRVSKFQEYADNDPNRFLDVLNEAMAHCDNEPIPPSTTLRHYDMRVGIFGEFPSNKANPELYTGIDCVAPNGHDPDSWCWPFGQQHYGLQEGADNWKFACPNGCTVFTDLRFD